MSTNPLPRRQRLHFGIRTMLSAITILGVAAGLSAYNVRWMRDRREVLLTRWGPQWQVIGYKMADRQSGSPKAPFPLGILGEPGCESIHLLFPSEAGGGELSTKQKSEIERIKGLFPEAIEIDWIIEPAEWFNDRPPTIAPQP